MSDLFEEGNPMKGVKRHNHTERTRQSGYQYRSAELVAKLKPSAYRRGGLPRP